MSEPAGAGLVDDVELGGLLVERLGQGGRLGSLPLEASAVVVGGVLGRRGSE